ncbi:MAG: translesion DNA synthesis-associated protein ImuA [Gammaproteobacteria bacterium]|nr:translesion DNA synthesis-associated protein ImuA [Gammaproteobacteria bacterium]MCP5298433.1 translesion DNA synthesis-associated protein ImuA [Chromatiaceae bacterium]
MQAVDLDALKRSGALWRGRRSVLMAGRVLGSGWAVLDEVLGGGWPRAALVEVLGDAHLGLSLLLPLLADLSLESRWLTWVAPPYLPYAPALAARGIRVERVLLVQQVSDEQALWAAEQVLKSGACSLLLAWPDRAGARGLDTARLRRLQLAAEQGDCTGVLFRPLRAVRQGSTAALRLRVRPAPLGLEVEVLKRRGGWGGGTCIVPMHAGTRDEGRGARQVPLPSVLVPGSSVLVPSRA